MSKKLLIAILAVEFVLILCLAGLLFSMLSKKTATNQNKTTETTHNSKATGSVEDAVNKYCEELGKATGITQIKTGYIISQKFSEEILSDSPSLLRYKEVGNAAAGTVDCYRGAEGMGISNDLLLVKDDGSWTYVDEVQNNTSQGFACSILDKYTVSKDLVSQCSHQPSAKPQPR